MIMPMTMNRTELLHSRKRPIEAISKSPIRSLPLKKRIKEALTEVVNPADFVTNAFESRGISVDELVSQAEKRFRAPSQTMIEAHTQELLQAVRDNNLDKLKQFHESGVVLESSNKFGESLLHLACRRGRSSIVRFLVQVVQVNLDVRDDYRRTPLHDACWTSEPNFDILKLLITEAPEHLLLQDVRGFPPFDYVRREHWSRWMEFLREHQELLQPKKN